MTKTWSLKKKETKKEVKERKRKERKRKRMGDSLNDRASLNSLRYIHRSPTKKLTLPLSLLELLFNPRTT